MPDWKWFVLGLLVGWMLEWIIDWVWWRKRCTPASPLPNSTATHPVALAASSAPVMSSAIADEPAAAPAVASVSAPRYAQDDLEAIEGIGPKIAQLLRDSGITTFSQLAQTPVEQVSKVLQDAGPNFRLAKPDSWREQAALAAAQAWDQLEALQKELVGGVRKPSVNG